MFKGSETIAIYYSIENKQSIECRVIQCYSFKFPEEEDKKRNVWCFDVLIDVNRPIRVAVFVVDVFHVLLFPTRLAV